MTSKPLHREKRALLALLAIIALTVAAVRFGSCSTDIRYAEETPAAIPVPHAPDTAQNAMEKSNRVVKGKKGKRSRTERQKPTGYPPSSPLEKPVKNHMP